MSDIETPLPAPAEPAKVLSLRDQILAADDIPEELVEVPEWECTILVRGLTAGARSAMVTKAGMDAAESGQQLNLSAIYPDLVIGTAHDPVTRQLIFTQADTKLLAAKSGAATERLAMVGMRLSGFTNEAAKAAGKDSSKTASDDSSSS